MNPIATDIGRPGGNEGTSPACARVFNSLYDLDELNEALAAERPNRRRMPTLELMRDRGADRELTLVTPEMVNGLAGLADDQPNCANALAYIRRQLALSRLATPPTLRWPPILLEGPPGVGKTHFAQALARWLDNELSIINCSTVTASFVLAGNNPSWHESRPGKIFETLDKGRFANPIVLLDEVDKLGGDPRFDGYGPLYQLLEEQTAKRFVDEHVGLPVDASNIIWIATANDASALPEAIRSRFHALFIAAPDAAQSEAVVQSVYHELLERELGWRLAFAPKLAPDVAKAMADISPREMRRVLLSAMGRAALKRPADEALVLQKDDLDPCQQPAPTRIGFLS